MNQEIITYIKEARAHGLSDTEIKQNLLSAGWSAEEVEENFVMSKTGNPGGANPTLAAQTLPAWATGSPAREPQHSATPAQPLPAEQPAVFTAQQLPATVTKKKSSGGLLVLIIGVVVVVLAAGGYFAYTYAYNNPQKIWQKFTQNPQSSLVYKNNITFTYNDPETYTPASSSLMSIQLKNLILSVNGNIYADLTDPKNPATDVTVQYNFSDNGTNFGTSIAYKLINNVLYLNAGSNPFAQALMSEISPGTQNSWLKIDLTAAQQQASTTNSQYSALSKQFEDPAFQQELQGIWNKGNVITVTKYLGQQKIGSAQTYHFQNGFNKSAFSAVVSQYIDAFAQILNNNQQGTISSSDTATAKQITAELINKIQVTDFETWIGSSDYRLYKIQLSMNAPSVISIMNAATNETQGAAGDDKRLNDAQEMSTALELYYNDHGGYPDANQGQPVGITPDYLEAWPVAPTPAGGNCTDYYNTYWYTPEGNKTVAKDTTGYSSYKLDFCLGSDTGDYKAGVVEISPSGIQNIDCPEDLTKCYTDGKAPGSVPAETTQQKIQDIINKINFDGSVNITSTYSDYGQKQAVVPPADSVDLLKALNQQNQTFDAHILR